MNTRKKMRLFREFNDKLEIWLMLWLYGYIIVVVAVEVVRRFGLDFSSLWGEETARYMFVYLTWIGAAAAIKNRTHIRIDLFPNMLSARGKASLNTFATICAMTFACFALYLSIDPVLVSFRFGSVTDGLRITKGWFLLAVPFGFSLVLWRSVQSLLIDIADLRAGTVTERKENLFN
jgi:TRAP-type C4-dicarboxylate transport system permease small subunit